MSRIVLSDDVLRRGVTVRRPLAWDDTPYFFRERFRAVDIGATINGKGARPGPGSLVAAQTDGTLSIASSGLVASPQSTPTWGDLGVASSVSAPRSQSPGVVSHVTADGGLCGVGLYSSASVSNASLVHGLVIDGSQSLITTTSGDTLIVLEIGDNAADVMIAANPAGGAMYLQRLDGSMWLLFAATFGPATTPLFCGVSNYTSDATVSGMSLVKSGFKYTPDVSVSSPSTGVEYEIDSYAPDFVYGLANWAVATVSVSLAAGWANGDSVECRIPADGLAGYMSVRLFKVGGVTKLGVFYVDGGDTELAAPLNTTLSAGSSCYLQTFVPGAGVVNARVLLSDGTFDRCIRAVEGSDGWLPEMGLMATNIISFEKSSTVTLSNLTMYSIIRSEVSLRI